MSGAALLLAGAGCGDPLYVNVEIPRVCITQGPFTVPGLPIAGEAEIPYAVDLGTELPLLRTRGVEELVLVVEEARLTPLSGAPDLSGVTDAALLAGVERAKVLRYTRDPAAPPPTALVLTGGSTNLAPYATSGTLPILLALSGQPPRTAWSGEVTTCLRAQSKVTYGP